MGNLTSLSLKRPVTTMMVFTSLIVIGALASKLLPLEYFPDVSYPGIWIEVPYPGSTPDEVEDRLIRPMEEALLTLSGVEEMNSNAGADGGGVWVGFSFGTNTQMKSIEIREKLDAIRDQLPDDFDRYILNKFSSSDQPILNLRVSGNRDLSNGYELLYRNLKLPLERIEGVSKVDLYGVEKDEIQIDVDGYKLQAFGIDLGALVEQLRQESFNVTASKVTIDDRRFIIKPLGELTTVEELRELPISANGLRLKDVADVRLQKPEVDYGRHLNRKYAIGLDIFKESGANTVEVSDRVLEAVEKAKKNKALKGIEIFSLGNQAEGIQESIQELLNSGLIGALFSIIVLYFFLRNLTNTLLVALAVPFSLLVTLGALYFLGYSLNILSMMGLMLAVGMLVDNAVVVAENIVRYRQTEKNMFVATVKATKEVGLAVTAGTLTSIIVFLPNIVNQGDMTAVYLSHVAVTICIALTASLLISLTVIPLLSYRLQTNAAPSKPNPLMEKMSNYYVAILVLLMKKRWAAVLLLLLVMGSAALPFSFVTVEMFENEQGRNLRLFYNLNGNYVVEKVEASVNEIEAYLFENQEKFEFESVYSYYNTNFAVSTINLVEKENATKSADQIKKEIREGLPSIAIGKPTFEFIDRNGGEGLKIFLIGESTDALVELAEDVQFRLSKLEGFVEVKSDVEVGAEEIRLDVDQDRASQFGITAQQVAQWVSGAFRGQRVQRINTDIGEIDVFVSMVEEDQPQASQLSSMSIMGENASSSVTLGGITTASTKSSANRIFREERQTSMGINIGIEDITKEEAREKLTKVMNSIQFPAGYGWSFGRGFRNDQETMDTMLFNMLLALILIYIVMAALFESLLYPSSIITAILFAVVGVFWFFWITGTTFSFMAMIGILILMGVVVNNGIVLVDHINQLRNKGIERDKAILQAGKDRFRAILMTAATTVLGLIPLSLGETMIGGDGPPYYPMARAIIGGLLFSTFITLILLPTIYILLDELKKWSSTIVNTALRQ